MDDIQLQMENIELCRQHLGALQRKRAELEELTRIGRETIEQSSEMLKRIDDLQKVLILKGGANNRQFLQIPQSAPLFHDKPSFRASRLVSQPCPLL
jgi:hypothetical protein